MTEKLRKIDARVPESIYIILRERADTLYNGTMSVCMRDYILKGLKAEQLAEDFVKTVVSEFLPQKIKKTKGTRRSYTKPIKAKVSTKKQVEIPLKSIKTQGEIPPQGPLKKSAVQSKIGDKFGLIPVKNS